MSQMTDRDYLLGSQYRDSSNLDARVHLHEGFSTNPLGLHPWVFQQLDLPEGCKILDVGCGPGYLWLENLDRIPPTWQILLSDFSRGMAAVASTELASQEQFRFAVLDVQAIPLPDEHFDAVIANHMLHHVPARDQALREVWRVLKPAGRFYATTNGRRHLLELRDFVYQFENEDEAVLRLHAWDRLVDSFSLENGREILSPWFKEIELRRYEDSLEITEVEPVISYTESSSLLRVQPDKLGEFRAFLDAQIIANGAVRITKDSGLFSAIRR